ncbi:MAG: hypothetical protein M3453_11870 [Pseudomonadota bacterium]|nr:hypothetical protein [Pseudomonadota bacterium]
MTKLSDAQLVVLAAACQRPDRNVLPLPERLKGGAAQKIVASLIGQGLIEEVLAAAGEPMWRQAEDSGRTTLQATAAAFQALGIEPEVCAEDQPAEDSEPVPAAVDEQADTPAQAAKAARRRMPRATSPPEPNPRLRTPQPGKSARAGRTPSRRSSSPCWRRVDGLRRRGPA